MCSRTRQNPNNSEEAQNLNIMKKSSFGLILFGGLLIALSESGAIHRGSTIRYSLTSFGAALSFIGFLICYKTIQDEQRLFNPTQEDTALRDSQIREQLVGIGSPANYGPME